MHSTLRIVVVLGLCVAGGLAMACSASAPESQQVAQSQEAPSVASDAGNRTGQEVFASTCAVCHGSEGEGVEDWRVRDEDGRLPPPPLNGDGHTWHHSDGVLYRIVSEGGLGLGFGSNMPSFKDDLSRVEIVAVIEFVKTLWEGKEIDGFLILDSQRELSVEDPYPSGELEGLSAD